MADDTDRQLDRFDAVLRAFGLAGIAVALLLTAAVVSMTVVPWAGLSGRGAVTVVSLLLLVAVAVAVRRAVPFRRSDTR